MANHKKRKNIFFRYARIIKRGFKRLTHKKILRWLRLGLKRHPFILGVTIFIWLNWFINKQILFPDGTPNPVVFYIGLILFWVLLVVVSDLLKEKQPVKWYLRKRFIFLTLLLFSPFGIVLLWSGSKFKKSSKIILTLIFGTIFMFTNVYYKEHYDQFKDNAFIEDIFGMISKPKKKVFLKTISPEVLKSVKFPALLQENMQQLSVSDITSRASSSVVSIKTKGKDGRMIGIGSGFVISEDGVIATNFHVLESAYQVEVKIGEKIFNDVTFIKGAPEVDIALIKIETDGLTVLPIGNSDNLVNGQLIVVLGNPWGLERTVSNGLVSALRFQDNLKLIQISAPVSPGSSGGPVLNEFGEVVGITTIASFLFAQNLNFAIPINYLDRILKD